MLSILFLSINITFQLIPDPNKYSLQRYGVPDQAHIGCPSILIDLKGYDSLHADVKYVFFCRDNKRLFDRLQQKVNQQKTNHHRPSSIRNRFHFFRKYRGSPLAVVEHSLAHIYCKLYLACTRLNE